MISRRRFLQATAATIATSSGFGYMHYCEPGWFELIRHRLAFFKDNAAPFKILFLADLHYSRFVPLSLISDAIALGIEQKPDLILLGGDYVLFDMSLNFSAFSDVLSPLAECAPTFACFGNHDRPHGGQLRVPLVGEPFAPVEDKRYVAGLNAFGERHIYTTRGVGSLYGLRLNCRPEVTMLELV